MKRIIVLLCVFMAATFTSCGYSEDDLAIARSEGFDAGYKEGYAAGNNDGYTEGYLEGCDLGYMAALSDFPEYTFPEYPQDEAVSRPTSGTILSGQEYYSGYEITVTADSSCDYAVSLKTASGTERICFYVRAGETVTVGVPSEYLYVYFASGTEWTGYGKGLMFGKDTVYSKDNELIDFTEYSWEYTLYPVNNGNFSQTPSDADEFF